MPALIDSTTTTEMKRGSGLVNGTGRVTIFVMMGVTVVIMSFLCAWWKCKKRNRRYSGPLERGIDPDRVSRVSNISFNIEKLSIDGSHAVFLGSASGTTLNENGKGIDQDQGSNKAIDLEDFSFRRRRDVLRGTAPGTTVNQNVKENGTGTPYCQTGTPDPDQVEAVADKAKEALKKVYTTTGSWVQMLPWVDANKTHIMDIYTKLRLVEQVDKKGKIHKKETMESYEEIFHFETREGNPIKRVVIIGSAGMGKTVLISKIAYDWALGQSETLNKFELVFVLNMRSLKQGSDLMDAIFDQLLDRDSVDKSILKEFIDKNQEKVLILLDGFDEFQTSTLVKSLFGSILKVLNRKQGIECWAVITSRLLDKLVDSSLVEKPYTRVEIKGFSDTDIEDYVLKFFPDDHSVARKLIKKIQSSDVLSELAEFPMLLLLLCLLWDAKNTLPDTMTRLYKKAFKHIFERKERNIGEDAVSKILIAIGKVALNGLMSTNQPFSLREEDFEKSALEAAMGAGVLSGERVVVDGNDTCQSVYFIHHTFLEYCAAMYWRSLINTKEFNRVLNQMLEKRCYFQYLFRFCCGDNEACTKRILKKLHKEREDPRLALVCYFESQSKKLPSENVINSVLTDDVHLSCWDTESINAFIYFLKRVAGQTGGKAHLAKVKKLEIISCNLHRFVEDLAELLKLMTNLHCICLSYCSLTTASSEQILSSLARSSSTLTKLDLSGNEALGGSALLWAASLKQMKHLKELDFGNCALTCGDMKPIAETVSEMPTLVHLDLSLNQSLGEDTSLWAPYWEQMAKHIKELK